MGGHGARNHGRQHDRERAKKSIPMDDEHPKPPKRYISCVKRRVSVRIIRVAASLRANQLLSAHGARARMARPTGSGEIPLGMERAMQVAGRVHPILNALRRATRDRPGVFEP
jgi:hypothetical protein